jgi:hypothetical protein
MNEQKWRSRNLFLFWLINKAVNFNSIYCILVGFFFCFENINFSNVHWFKVGQVKYAFGQVTFGGNLSDGNLSDGQVEIKVNVEPWTPVLSFLC